MAPLVVITTTYGATSDDQIVKLAVFFSMTLSIVVGVLIDNIQKPDDLTAAIINTFSPNEALMSD